MSQRVNKHDLEDPSATREDAIKSSYFGGLSIWKVPSV